MNHAKAFAIDYLKAVEKKHRAFFESNHLSIMNCVTFKGSKLLTVHMINNLLPDDIAYEIEVIFWID